MASGKSYRFVFFSSLLHNSFIALEESKYIVDLVIVTHLLYYKKLLVVKWFMEN